MKISPNTNLSKWQTFLFHWLTSHCVLVSSLLLFFVPCNPTSTPFQFAFALISFDAWTRADRGECSHSSTFFAPPHEVLQGCSLRCRWRWDISTSTIVRDLLGVLWGRMKLEKGIGKVESDLKGLFLLGSLWNTIFLLSFLECLELLAL